MTTNNFSLKIRISGIEIEMDAFHAEILCKRLESFGDDCSSEAKRLRSDIRKTINSGACVMDEEYGGDAKTKKTPTGLGSTSNETVGSVWRADLPDDEMTVLVRVRDENCPVVVGFHEDGRWYDSNAFGEVAGKDVLGWMHLGFAAEILDTVSDKGVSL